MSTAQTKVEYYYKIQINFPIEHDIIKYRFTLQKYIRKKTF